MNDPVSTPIYLVVWRCLDCEMVTAIDSAWLKRTDADERVAFLDKRQAQNDKQLLTEILEMVAA